MVHSEPIFAEFVLISSPKIVCNFLPSKLRSSKYVLRENFQLSCRGSYTTKEGSFLCSCSRGGVGVFPRKFLKNGCKWCILSPSFAEFVLISSRKIVCNFCPQSSDLRNTYCGRIFNLAVEDHIQPKEGSFLCSRSRGGGSGLPEKIFEKRMQMMHFESIHSRLVGIFLKLHFCLERKDPGGNTKVMQYSLRDDF